MARVYRLAAAQHTVSRKAILSGAGAAKYGGRWNQAGTPMIYASAHVSLAALEMLVHASTLPLGQKLVALDIPDDAPIARWSRRSLPRDWNAYPAPAATQARGTAWAHSGRELAVWVPSAVVPPEDNCLLNPAHPDMARVKVRVVGPFPFDARLRP